MDVLCVLYSLLVINLLGFIVVVDVERYTQSLTPPLPDQQIRARKTHLKPLGRNP